MITPELITKLDIVPGTVVLMREYATRTGRLVIVQVNITQVEAGALKGDYVTSSERQPFNEERMHGGSFPFANYELLMVMSRPTCRRQKPPVLKRLGDFTAPGAGDMIVEADWLYSYDGGGLPSIIPKEAPVQPEWVGKKAREAVLAWEYFLLPAYGRCNRCGIGPCTRSGN